MSKNPNNYLDKDCNLDLYAVEQEINFLVNNYCLCDERTLTKDAIKLRKEIERFIDKMATLQYEKDKYAFLNM